MKNVIWAVCFTTLGLVLGYLVGVWQWRGMAVMESYVIGYDQGWNSGVSDAAAAYKSGGADAVVDLSEQPSPKPN